MAERPWFKCFPSDFLNGVSELSPNELAVYTVCIMRMYDEGGAITDDPDRIARRCNMRPTTCRKVLDALCLDPDKLTRDGGVLINPRAMKVIESRQKVSEKSATNARGRWTKEAEKRNDNNEAVMQPHENDDANGMLSICQSLEARKKEPPLKGVPPLSDEAPDISLPAALDRTAVGAMVNAWNALAAECDLAAVQRVTAARRAKAKARLWDCGGLDGWAEALTKVRDSPFLRGDNDRGFRADFDFLLQKSSFTKLLEGSYARVAGKDSGRSSHRGTGPPGLVATANELIEEYRRSGNGSIRDDPEGIDKIEGGDAPTHPGDH